MLDVTPGALLMMTSEDDVFMIVAAPPDALPTVYGCLLTSSAAVIMSAVGAKRLL